MSRPRSYCVFCGSSPGSRPEYARAARTLGAELGRRGLGLVYGGARVGLMGMVADAAKAEGATVAGIIPEFLVQKEVAHEGLDDLRIVGSMHERKALMAELSDGFIALPGGMGTLEELCEILTWAQLGAHAKPCGLLNVDGYYDHLLAHLERAADERFMHPEHRDMLIVETDPGALLDRYAAYSAPTIDKWVDRT